MGRVLRLLRLVKTIQGFDALYFGRREFQNRLECNRPRPRYIMTTAMQGSVTVLFWSFVCLGLVSAPDVCIGRCPFDEAADGGADSHCVYP